ncbi:MAG: hypothetical protein H6Q65_735 [Firmicutes bacterium]|nr:hypothetical protein [Bacillota bacterium]
MIIAEQKPLAEIAESVQDVAKVLVVGCGGCVTVCLSGGENEAEVLASALRIKRGIDGIAGEVGQVTVERQCDPEYVAKLDTAVDGIDAVVSLACGVGVQFLAERYSKTVVVPAQNTKFAGGTVEHGVWEERCGLCGECVLAATGGICPIIRCSKSLLNGPCGGSAQGYCEVGKDIPCAWVMIYERLKKLGREASLCEIAAVKDWSKSRDGGPRKIVREDLRL